MPGSAWTHDVAVLRARYRAMAEALEQVHLEELAALSDEDAVARMLSLKLFRPARREPNEWSGLVDQQRIFARAQRR
jgi:hypothetical protein